jgi:hypothetical protein
LLVRETLDLGEYWPYIYPRHEQLLSFLSQLSNDPRSLVGKTIVLRERPHPKSQLGPLRSGILARLAKSLIDVYDFPPSRPLFHHIDDGKMRLFAGETLDNQRLRRRSKTRTGQFYEASLEGVNPDWVRYGEGIVLVSLGDQADESAFQPYLTLALKRRLLLILAIDEKFTSSLLDSLLDNIRKDSDAGSIIELGESF